MIAKQVSEVFFDLVSKNTVQLIRILIEGCL
jgi:hypothetical protein